jgi:hypothetical protein
MLAKRRFLAQFSSPQINTDDELLECPLALAPKHIYHLFEKCHSAFGIPWQPV